MNSFSFIYLRGFEEEIRLRRILYDFLEIVDVGMAIKSEMRRKQVGTWIVGDLWTKKMKM